MQMSFDDRVQTPNEDRRGAQSQNCSRTIDRLIRFLRIGTHAWGSSIGSFPLLSVRRMVVKRKIKPRKTILYLPTCIPGLKHAVKSGSIRTDVLLKHPHEIRSYRS